MLLAIDIENKITNVGIIENKKLIGNFEITTDKNKSVDEIYLIIKLMLMDKEINFSDIDHVIISTVVPELLESYSKISQKITNKNPIIISPGVKTGINIKCENPKEVGTDRVIRAVGASDIYDKNIIIISASTITTIDYINEKKEFLGGVILPGIDLFEKSLHQESAKLPHVEILRPKKILGNNTTKSIQSGIFHAYQNACWGIVENIIDERKLKNEKPEIIITGKYANFLANDSSKQIPSLGLIGLGKVFEINKEK